MKRGRLSRGKSREGASSSAALSETELRFALRNLFFTGIVRNRLPRRHLGNLLPSFPFEDSKQRLMEWASERSNQ